LAFRIKEIVWKTSRNIGYTLNQRQEGHFKYNYRSRL